MENKWKGFWTILGKKGICKILSSGVMKYFLIRVPALSLWIAVVVLSSLTGCTLHITKDISDRLKLDELYKSYNVSPIDLSLQSKCQKPPTVKIINAEARIDDYDTMSNPPVFGVINPKEMMDSVVVYLGNGFQQSRVKVDDQSHKVLQIKMIDLISIAGIWTFGSYFKTEIVIPETGFTKFYEARDNAISGYTAPAYAIHAVSRQIIDDPVIQDYILCKTEYAESLKVQKKEKSLSQKLQELQTALDNGLISKEEYQLKRKELLEKH